jgi:hypothetical protein
VQGTPVGIAPEWLAGVADVDRDAEGRLLFVEPCVPMACTRPPEVVPETQLFLAARVLRQVELQLTFDDRWIVNGEILALDRQSMLTILASDLTGSDSTPPEPAPPRVTGVVHDAAGLPLAGVPLWLDASDGSTLATTQTFEDGRYELVDLAPGSVRLTAGGGAWGVAETQLELAPGGELEWSPRLLRGDELSGVLLDEGGQPLAGWTLFLSDPLLGYEDSTSSDERGVFVIPNVPAQALRLRVIDPDPGFESGGVSHYPTLVLPRVQAAGPPLELCVGAAERDYASLALRVTDEAGLLLNDAEVRLEHLTSEVGDRLALEGAEDPRFVCGKLPPGDYVLDIGHGDHGWRRLGPFRLRPGQALDLGDIALPAPSHLSLSFARAPQDEATEARTHLWRASPDVWTRRAILEDMAPRWFDLPLGSYLVRSQASAEDSTPAASILELASHARTGLEIEVGPASTLREGAYRSPPQPAEPYEPSACGRCHGRNG